MKSVVLAFVSGGEAAAAALVCCWNVGGSTQTAPLLPPAPATQHPALSHTTRQHQLPEGLRMQEARVGHGVGGGAGHVGGAVAGGVAGVRHGGIGLCGVGSRNGCGCDRGCGRWVGPLRCT